MFACARTTKAHGLCKSHTILSDFVSILSPFFSAGQREEAMKQKGEISSELANLRDELGKRPVKPHKQFDVSVSFLFSYRLSGCHRVSGSFSISADTAGLL